MNASQKKERACKERQAKVSGCLAKGKGKITPIIGRTARQKDSTKPAGACFMTFIHGFRELPLTTLGGMQERLELLLEEAARREDLGKEAGVEAARREDLGEEAGIGWGIKKKEGKGEEAQAVKGTKIQIEFVKV